MIGGLHRKSWTLMVPQRRKLLLFWSPEQLFAQVLGILPLMMDIWTNCWYSLMFDSGKWPQNACDLGAALHIFSSYINQHSIIDPISDDGIPIMETLCSVHVIFWHNIKLKFRGKGYPARSNAKLSHPFCNSYMPVQSGLVLWPGGKSRGLRDSFSASILAQLHSPHYLPRRTG